MLPDRCIKNSKLKGMEITQHVIYLYIYYYTIDDGVIANLLQDEELQVYLQGNYTRRG